MNFKLFAEQTQPLIGVDVSASAVKMVELAGLPNGQHRIQRYAIVGLPPEVIQDGNIANAALLEAALTKAWQTLDTYTRRVALALPAASVSTTRMLVPGQSNDSEIELQAEAESLRLISFPPDELSFDFQRLGPNEENPDDLNVLVVMTRRERVDERVALVEAAGLEAVIMDIDGYAAVNAYMQTADQLPNGGKGQTVALIDIGLTSTRIRIIDNNSLVDQREHPFGGQLLTQEFGRQFSLTWQEAESRKRSDTPKTPEEQAVLAAFCETMAQEVGRALDIYFASSNLRTIDHILLTGGATSVAGLDKAISRQTRIDTHWIKPFKNLPVSKSINPHQLAVDAPSLLIAYGLALRQFDPI